jgi:transcriptional regulator with XRE-family HTH domain
LRLDKCCIRSSAWKPGGGSNLLLIGRDYILQLWKVFRVQGHQLGTALGRRGNQGVGEPAPCFSQAELGARLKQARKAAGLTQEEVSRELDIARTAVALIESGARSVSSLELDRLAFLYGRDMRDFFASEFGSENALAGLFRKNRDIAEDAEAVSALRRCMSVGRELTNLERLVGIDRDPSSAVRYNLPVSRSRFGAIRQGASVAEQERRRLGIGEAPVIDVTELLEKHGVRAAVVDLPEDISGLTLVDVEAGPFVAASRGDHLLRRNFSFRHRFLSLALETHRREAISRGKLEELFAILLEKPREEIALAEDGLLAEEPSTPVEIPG